MLIFWVFSNIIKENEEQNYVCFEYVVKIYQTMWAIDKRSLMLSFKLFLPFLFILYFYYLINGYTNYKWIQQRNFRKTMCCPFLISVKLLKWSENNSFRVNFNSSLEKTHLLILSWFYSIIRFKIIYSNLSYLNKLL